VDFGRRFELEFASSIKREISLQREMKQRWLVLAAVAIVGFALDWWTKMLAAGHLGGEPFRLLGSYVELTLVYNKAALFGLDPRRIIPGFPINIFFTFFTILAIAVLVAYYRHLKKSEILLHWGLATILPGAMGNLFDRIVHPSLGVVDFIKLDLRVWPFNPWPVFNLADFYVTLGVGLMIVSFILEERRRKRGSEIANAAPGHPSRGAQERDAKTP
jgi:signal peptidase II